MSEDVLSPLLGPDVRIQNKAELDEFLTRPDAQQLVQASSFEQLFFTIKALGLPDAIPLLQYATERQIRGFIDLDCWRKDSFVPRPFMQWIAAFVEVGPEATVRALSGIDEHVVATFLKDRVTVYELERDDPPPEGNLMLTPDNRFAVGQTDRGESAVISSLILDALFRYDPELGYRLLRLVRYKTRMELEEIAYQAKIRRLDVHGFVDYYESLSIYASTEAGETSPEPRVAMEEELVPGEEGPGSLPTVFASSLREGGFLLEVLARAPTSVAERLSQELTALGNRILSANLVNLGEVEGIRVALQEMRDVVTIGLEQLSGNDESVASEILANQHVQTVFKHGFNQLARLRESAERFVRVPGFSLALLESPDHEFLSGLERFKPLLWDGERYRNFETLEDVETAARRLDQLRQMVEGWMGIFGPVEMSLRKAFNTAVISKAMFGRFELVPIEHETLERFLAGGIRFPPLDLPPELERWASEWGETLRSELEPLIGRTIDPRFIDSIQMRL